VARLVLVDTADALPGLLPLHAWTALMSSDLILVGDADHPFAPHLADAELRVEVAGADTDDGARPLSRTDLLSGVTQTDKRRAERVVDRVRAVGEVAYLFGPADHEGFTRLLGMEAARSGIEVEVVYFGLQPPGTTLLELVSVMTRLRGPGGCPWDAEQTHLSLARYAVEEVYELVEAISSGDADAVREELGDVLLQVVFHAEVARTSGGAFDVDAVARGIVDKLVRRHPHVFADAQVADAAGVAANWERLKAAEKPERTALFDGVPTAQPALQYTEQLQRRAARAGFDWDADVEAAHRVRLELDEFLAAADDDARAHEVGDLLMSVVGLARRHGLDPELALRSAARRFRTRLESVLADVDHEAGTTTWSRAEWLDRWERAKSLES